MFNMEEDLLARVRQIADMAWAITVNQVAGGRLIVTNEATLQMNYGVILRQVGDLFRCHQTERLEVELEKSVMLNSKKKNLDVYLTLERENTRATFCVELKFYNWKATSGGNRGAMDIWMREVYLDIKALEEVRTSQLADDGYVLAVCEHPNIPSGNLTGKQVAYSLATGHIYKAGTLLDTVVGNKETFKPTLLDHNYRFEWNQTGAIWSIVIEPSFSQANHYTPELSLDEDSKKHFSISIS